MDQPHEPRPMGERTRRLSMSVDPPQQTPHRLVRAFHVLIRIACPWATLGVVIAAVCLPYAMLFTDDLGPASRWLLAWSYLAFMLRAFEPHLAIACAAACGVLLVGHRRRAALVAIAVAGAWATPTLWSAWAGGVRTSDAPSPVGTPQHTIRVLSSNLLVWSAAPHLVQAEIDAADPDLILFQEYTSTASHVLVPALSREYPFFFENSSDTSTGQAIFSRVPFVQTGHITTEGVPLSRDDRAATNPQLFADVEIDGVVVHIVCVHTFPPDGLTLFDAERRQFRTLADHAAGIERPVLLMGDFNSPTGTPQMRTMLVAGNLHDANAGFGLHATWPKLRWWMRPIPGVRLDQALTRGLVCESSRVLGPINSDHLPILMEFRLEAGMSAASLPARSERSTPHLRAP